MKYYYFCFINGIFNVAYFKYTRNFKSDDWKKYKDILESKKYDTIPNSWDESMLHKQAENFNKMLLVLNSYLTCWQCKSRVLIFLA